MTRFDGRVALVTGAARGLGRDYAKYFASDGANVVVADVGDTTKAVADAAAAGPRCIGVEADVTDAASLDALVARIRSEFGRLDILVNNAGLWRLASGLLNVDDADWDAGWAVNVTGTLRCFRACVPLMVEREWGRVVNISSIASRSGSGVYGLTKNAVNEMTRGMAAEVGEHNITVNCVAPGISAFEGARSQIAGAEVSVARNIIKRFGTSRDLYGAIRYLCSDDAEWVTGQTLFVDGGSTAAG